MVHVIATIEVTPGKREEFLGYFRRLVPLVHAEQGCQYYEPTIDVGTSISAQQEPRGDVVTVVERWDDLEALETHLIAPHMQTFREQTKSLIQNVSLQILSPA
ncbi:MAG: putative quinol monooxygenase [Pirellulaceae bacterium]|nr:antibiotic biosynthesis monooxygenase [Planctomycetales bacterium]